MDFKDFKKIYEEQNGYGPDYFEDELEQGEEAIQFKQQSDREQSEYENQVEVLLSKYFQKGNDNIVAALDGFSADLAEAFRDYIQNKWVSKEYFAGRDNDSVTFSHDISQVLDKNLPKLSQFFHDLGPALEDIKTRARK